MLAKIMRTIRSLQAYQMIVGERPTIGELSKVTGVPYSSLRRQLIIASNSKLVDCELEPYKSTGKRVFFITQHGIDWLDGYRSMF